MPKTFYDMAMLKLKKKKRRELSYLVRPVTIVTIVQCNSIDRLHNR